MCPKKDQFNSSKSKHEDAQKRETNEPEERKAWSRMSPKEEVIQGTTAFIQPKCTQERTSFFGQGIMREIDELMRKMFGRLRSEHSARLLYWSRWNVIRSLIYKLNRDRSWWGVRKHALCIAGSTRVSAFHFERCFSFLMDPLIGLMVVRAPQLFWGAFLNPGQQLSVQPWPTRVQPGPNPGPTREIPTITNNHLSITSVRFSFSFLHPFFNFANASVKCSLARVRNVRKRSPLRQVYFSGHSDGGLCEENKQKWGNYNSAKEKTKG